MPEAARLQRLARRSVAERAYWAAVAHLCRGQPGASWDLLKFAFSRRPTTAVVPPLRYLLRERYAVDRIAAVASEMLRWPHAPARPAPADR